MINKKITDQQKYSWIGLFCCSPGPVVCGSSGPLVPWSSGPQALWPPGPLVLVRSRGLLVLCPPGPLVCVFGPFSCSLLAANFLQTYNAFGFGCLRSFCALLDDLH